MSAVPILKSDSHEHFCPVCKKKWDHENRSRITCYSKHERCWQCRLDAWYGPPPVIVDTEQGAGEQ